MTVVHTQQLEWADALMKGQYGSRKKGLPGEKLRCSVWELAPGKKSFPLHGHQITEEALYVLSGKAKVRTLEGETRIGPGDYVHFPAGGAAHQLINDGTEPLVYLGLSATAGMDVVTYPDTGKVAFTVGTFPTGKRLIFKEADQKDYFHDDKDA